MTELMPVFLRDSTAHECGRIAEELNHALIQLVAASGQKTTGRMPSTEDAVMTSWSILALAKKAMWDLAMLYPECRRIAEKGASPP